MTARTVATVIVHDAAEARRAICAAAAANAPLNLLSAPGAAGVLGARAFEDMVALALPEDGAARPTVQAILDCSDVPGDALRALRQGCRCIRIDAPDDVSGKLRDIAETRGATVYQGPIPALDLGLEKCSDDDLVRWISHHGTSSA